MGGWGMRRHEVCPYIVLCVGLCFANTWEQHDTVVVHTTHQPHHTDDATSPPPAMLTKRGMPRTTSVKKPRIRSLADIPPLAFEDLVGGGGGVQQGSNDSGSSTPPDTDVDDPVCVLLCVQSCAENSHKACCLPFYPYPQSPKQSPTHSLTFSHAFSPLQLPGCDMGPQEGPWCTTTSKHL